MRPKGQALGFGVRHRDDEWDEEKSKKGGGAGAAAAAKVLRAGRQHKAGGRGQDRMHWDCISRS